MFWFTRLKFGNFTRFFNFRRILIGCDLWSMIRALATARRTVASVSIKVEVFDLAIFFYLAVYWRTLDCRCLLISQLFHLLLCLLFKHFCFDDRVVRSVCLRDGILHLWSWFACFRIPLGSCFLHWLRNFLLGGTCRLFLWGGYSFDLRFFGDCRIRSFRFFLLIFVLFYFLL